MMEPDSWANGSGSSLPQYERPHEHASDEESSILEDEEHGALIHRRQRSYSDDGDGHLHHRRPRHIYATNSSDHESDSTMYHRGAQELHHRRHPIVRSGDGERTPPRGTQYPPGTNGKSSRQQPQHTYKRRRRAWTVWLRISVATGIVGYFVLVILGSQILQTTDWEPGTIPEYPSYHVHTGGETHSRREILERNRLELKQRTERQLQERAAARRARSSPPAMTASVELPPKRKPGTSSSTSQETEPGHRAPLDKICGTHARKASVVDPDSYLERDVLNSESRVLITGILNPVGFHLALTLKQRCGVEVMFGIDPMFPNTVENRLSLLTRIRLLITHLPKLVQPIVLPLIGLDPRLNKNKMNQPAMLKTTGELNLLNFNPTHIVHLASYSPEEYTNRRQPKFQNFQSPYVTKERQAPMYRIRSSLVAMEQILASMSSIDDSKSDDQRPHFTFASALPTNPDPIHRFTKTADEVLIDTYHSLQGTYAVGLRLPDVVYGPWGRPGTPLYELVQAALERWNTGETGEQLLEKAGLSNSTSLRQSLVYVEDVVDAIIATMQYRAKDSRPAMFDLSSPSDYELSTVASTVSSFLPESEATLDSRVIAEPSAGSQMTYTSLAWSPRSSLLAGLTRTVAWHLNEYQLFGDTDKQLETGDSFLKRRKAETCTADDFVCNAGRPVLPCASECSTREQCAPSVFDTIGDLIHEVTQECDIVLYTQSLGYDVRDLSLSAKYMEEGKQVICNFAFVPRESELVSAVIRKVPESQLEKFGISTSKASASIKKQRRLDGLNGRLLYKGWILLWVPDATTPLPTADKFLLKLSPGKLFSSDPKHALYIDEKFPVSPNIDDVLFLVGETHRAPFKGRSIYRHDDNGEKHKYKLAPEPERRAAILLAPLKRRAANDGKDQTLADTKLSVYEATKYMRFEIGENAAQQKESALVKKQREFYERIQTFTNRQDMRSNEEPWYRYETKHWIRSRWIVHDLKLEDARQLRCEWYSEHVPWGTDLDQLSFAHVMARREIERRIAQQEPDDHFKPVHVQEPILKEFSDAHEWHPLLGHQPEHVGLIEKVPKHMIEKDEHEGESSEIATDAPKHDDAPLFVRIMSERVMLLTRKAWQERRGSKTNGKRYRKKSK